MAAVDLGIKAATPRRLAALGCRVEVLPATVTAAEILAAGPGGGRPDGVFFSNGPGDPAALGYAVDAVRGVLEAGVPLFGICLGSQILGRALGLDTYKLRFGHRGINQPVKDLRTGQVHITSHNHGFALALPGGGGAASGRGGARAAPSVPHKIRPCADNAPEPERRRGGGSCAARRARVRRAVPPRGRARAARRGRPVRRVLRADGARPGCA